jgi:uncharacterized protein (TIGR02444 family)
MIGPRGDFPRFVLEVYGTDGVATASVLLQDRLGVDVNVLLLGAYAGAVGGISFTAADVASAVARTRDWQRDVVGPLRGVRTRLKVGPAPAPTPATAALRERIKTAELDAEMIELDELADVAAHLGSPAARGDAQARATAAMQVVLWHGNSHAPTDEEAAAIAVIASAAARFDEGMS